MFAQISEKASDPAAWSELAKTVGPAGLFSILLLILVAGLGYLAYRATIGPSGFVRTMAAELVAATKATLTHLTDSVDRLEAASKSDQQDQEDLRTCGREFARGMRTIAQTMHADVESEAAQVIATLSRRAPAGAS